MSLVTLGYGTNSMIVTKGYGGIFTIIRREVRRFTSCVVRVRDFMSHID